MTEETIKRGELIQKLKTGPELFILYSGATRCPYVMCDPETCDDTASVYFTEDAAKAAAEVLRGAKNAVNVVRLESRHFLLFYTSLYTMGINALAVNQDGVRTLIQLSEVVNRAKPEEKEGKVWIENPSLHLTALYLMQEVRRQPGKGQEESVKALLEEAIADFAKGRFIQPVTGEHKAVPLVQLPNGEKYQPVFTDIMEFEKFNRKNQFQALVVDGAKIPRILVKEAVGVAVNPLGVNLPLKITRPQQAAEPAQTGGIRIRPMEQAAPSGTPENAPEENGQEKES